MKIKQISCQTVTLKLTKKKLTFDFIKVFYSGHTTNFSFCTLFLDLVRIFFINFVIVSSFRI